MPTGARLDERCQEIFDIQTEGLAKRIKHTNAETVVVGISGGLDSTLALLVCVGAFDRLGKNRRGIVGITMPGFGTTDRTYTNAVNLMKLLGITIREISIKEACLQHFADMTVRPLRSRGRKTQSLAADSQVNPREGRVRARGSSVTNRARGWV